MKPQLKTALSFIFGLLGQSLSLAQDDSDAVRLRNMEYMKLSIRVDCKGEPNSSLDYRICANLEFQEADSILNVRFREFLDGIESDSLKTEFKNFHQAWVKNRRAQSELKSEGLHGHMLGIFYLDCMAKATHRRIEELEYLMQDE